MCRVDALVTVTAGLAAVATAAVLLEAVRTRRSLRAAIGLPPALGLTAVLAVVDRWPPTAQLLLLTVAAGPAALATVDGRPRAWLALGVYAVAGVTAGYAALDLLLAGREGDGWSVGPGLVTLVLAGLVALAAYAYLYVRGALDR